LIQLSNYSPDDFNDDGSLKVPTLLLGVIIYLIRHPLLIFLGGISSLAGMRRGIDVSGVSQIYSGPLFMMASFPAIIVLIALFLRSARAGMLIRKIWINGRWLLFIAVLLDIALVIYQWQMNRIQLDEIHLLGAILDIYILWYLTRSTRVRDTFADFPVSIQKPGA
jgi:hypothetical protein